MVVMSAILYTYIAAQAPPHNVLLLLSLQYILYLSTPDSVRPSLSKLISLTHVLNVGIALGSVYSIIVNNIQY